jgi:hypothetical protein
MQLVYCTVEIAWYTDYMHLADASLVLLDVHVIVECDSKLYSYVQHVKALVTGERKVAACVCIAC